jgi:hypothetical protein
LISTFLFVYIYNMYKFNFRVFFVGIHTIFLVGCFKGWTFYQKLDTIPSATLSLPMGNIYNVTILTCGARCKTEVNCLSFAYDQTYNKCVLYNEHKPSVLVSPYVNLYLGKFIILINKFIILINKFIILINNFIILINKFVTQRGLISVENKYSL